MVRNRAHLQTLKLPDNEHTGRGAFRQKRQRLPRQIVPHKKATQLLTVEQLRFYVRNICRFSLRIGCNAAGGPIIHTMYSTCGGRGRILSTVAAHGLSHLSLIVPLQVGQHHRYWWIERNAGRLQPTLAVFGNRIFGRPGFVLTRPWPAGGLSQKNPVRTGTKVRQAPTTAGNGNRIGKVTRTVSSVEFPLKGPQSSPHWYRCCSRQISDIPPRQAIVPSSCTYSLMNLYAHCCGDLPAFCTQVIAPQNLTPTTATMVLIRYDSFLRDNLLPGTWVTGTTKNKNMLGRRGASKIALSSASHSAYSVFFGIPFSPMPMLDSQYIPLTRTALPPPKPFD